MRLVATILLWLITTVLLAVAVPTAWAQHNLVDRTGYSALATEAAKNPRLQEAMAAELTTQLMKLSASSGFGGSERQFSAAARVYTASSAFPGQFALVNQVAHRWMFTDTVGQSDDSGRWTIDLSPMLADSSFQQTLTDFGIKAPTSLQIPLTENISNSLRPGQLRQLSTWGPWASIGAIILTGVFALLTLAAARARGKTLGALGVSALIVGAAGWAGIEVGRRYLDVALNHTVGNVRQVADVMVGQAIASLHGWLNLTLAAGGALVLLGVLFSMLGGLRRKRD